MRIERGCPCRAVFLIGQEAFQLCILRRPIFFVRIKGIGDTAPANIAGQDFLLRCRSCPALRFDLLQSANSLHVHAVLCFGPAHTQVIIGDAEVFF